MTDPTDDDPFAPEADPYRPPLAPSSAPESAAELPDDGGALEIASRVCPPSRRSALLVLVSVPLATTLGGCAVRALHCAAVPAHPSRCRQRFCRYYDGSAAT